MNKKLILTGKAVLSTVMASTMACSLLSTNVYAQESGLVTDEETTVEKAPVVDEETTTTEEATEVVEEAVDSNEESMVDDTTTVDETIDAPVSLAESSLQQSTNYPTGDYQKYTVEELKVMLAEKIAEVKNLWETNGKYDYYKDNQTIKQVMKYLAKAEEYLAEGNSTAMTFSWRVYEMTNSVKSLNSSANILTEIDKKIYALNKEKESLNETDYTADSWKAYTDKLSEAMTKVNGSGTSEEKKQQYYDEIVTLKNALVKVDKNLTTLKQLVAESEVIINSQLDATTKVSYTKASWDAFSKAYSAAFAETNKNAETIDKDLFDKLYNALLEAKNNLVEAEKVEGEETGVLKDWTEQKVGESVRIRGGQLYVSDEKTNGDGTTTVTVTWINDGTYPLTGGYFHNTNETTSKRFGGEYTLRPYKESDFKRAGDPFIKVSYADSNGASNTISEDLTVDAVVGGFVKEFTVPTGSSVSLRISNWGNDYYSYSLGTYYTKNVETVDKSALKAAIEKYENFESSHYSYEYFQKTLNEARKVYEDPAAEQSSVDYYATNVETRYYMVLVGEYNSKYAPSSWDYSKYTNESVLPLLNLYGEVRYRVNVNYFESGETIGTMKGWYEEYQEYEKGLVECTDSDTYVGLNEDALSSSSKRQGNFKVVKQEVVNVDGVYKIQLTMEFINDGLHPIYGSELPNASGTTKFSKFSSISASDATKARAQTYDSQMGSKRYVSWKNVAPLDGQNNYYGGFKGTLILEQDEEYVTFEFEKKSTEAAYSPWYYHVQPMDMIAPEYTVTYSNEGNLTNKDVTVTIKANEALQEVEGWTLSEDKLSLTKVYSENTDETVTIKDLNGIASDVPVNVTGIDKLGATVTVKNETVKDGVLVTLETSEPVQDIEGWTKVSDTKFTKLYKENASETIKVYDLAGNLTEAKVTVSNIGKPETGESDTKKEDSKKTKGTKTGVFTTTGLFAGSATAAAAGASLLAFLKKRKK